MQQTPELDAPRSVLEWILTNIGRLAMMLLIPVVGAAVFILGFQFLKDGNAPKWILSLVAIIWGVGGIAFLYWGINWIIEQLPDAWRRRFQPYLFIGPAMAILVWYLALPTLRTFWISLFDRSGPPSLARSGSLSAYFSAIGDRFVGLDNYVAVFTERFMLESFRNNLLWIIFGASMSVIFGLIVAVLADRSRYERVAKSLIFLPMAISFVGAGIIWNFIYEVKPAGEPQIGLLNALVTGLGGQPRAWLAWTDISPWNNLFLIIIVVWLQTGFAMVLFSAALKGIPGELLEAARVDGANEFQVFFRIMIPYIQGTIITVSTTIVIFTLKIFDVVLVMTGGQFGTEVIATQFYRQYFSNRNFGFGSAIAIVLLIAVIPVMIYNLRQFSDRKGF